MAAKCEMHGCGQKATTKRVLNGKLVAVCAAHAAQWDDHDNKAGHNAGL